MKTIHNLWIFFIKKKKIKNVQVSKAVAQSSFQNAKNVFVKPLESLMSGFTSSLFQLTVDLAKMFIEIMDSV